jgi:3D (Asp-Asp-Asp) domain-containing protein
MSNTQPSVTPPGEPQPQQPESQGSAGPAPLAGSVRETLYKQPGTREQVPATETVHTELHEVSATTVVMDRSGSEHITAERVNLDRSGAKSIDAKSAQLEHSGVLALGSENTVLLHSSAVQVVADEVRMSKSNAVVVVAGNATLEESQVVFFAGRATGDVHAVLDTRSAAIVGAAGGAVLALLLILVRGLAGSRD